MQETVGKKSRKEVEWEQRLARFAACGQQIKLFCQAESVSAATFYRWRKQLADTGAAAPAAGFINVGVLPPARKVPTMTQDAPPGAALEVRLDFGHGLVLHIVRR